jgi:hypothetical protein
VNTAVLRLKIMKGRRVVKKSISAVLRNVARNLTRIAGRYTTNADRPQRKTIIHVIKKLTHESTMGEGGNADAG